VQVAASAEADDAANRVRQALGLSTPTGEDGNGLIRVETQVLEGPASSVLISAAQEAELLILGSRGLGGFSRLVLGSTSTQCATHAPIPTAIVPLEAPVRPTHRLVVAFDGPDDVIDCVTVWDVTPIVVGADQFFFPEASDLARDRFEHLVSQVVDAVALDQPGVELPVVERHFVEGRPRAELSRVADDSDLLVMGARGHGAIGSAILGSVSTWLLHQVQRPMVVVPHPPEEETGQDHS
jgi:nucleotide-binding universal stress UspA family protein